MQKQIALLLAGSAVTLAAIAAPAQAQSQPQTFGTSHDTTCVGGNSAAECSLQKILERQTVAGTPVVNTGVSTGYELFTSKGSEAASSFLFEVAGFASHNKFGLFKMGDPLTKVQLFGGAATGGANQAVSFLANGAVQVGSQVIQNFGKDFGFYLEGPGGTFYSQNALNGGKQQAAIYQGNGQTQFNVGGQHKLFSDDTFMVAFEDVNLPASDRDYNDLVVLVSGIQAKKAPEPAAALGLGAVAATAALMRRRRQQG
jgi:hypothetical protein